MSEVGDGLVLPVTVTFQSKGMTAYEFLSQLESLPQLVHIREFHMTKTSKRNEMNIHLELWAYFQDGSKERENDD